jgi:hypothetical protein
MVTLSVYNEGVYNDGIYNLAVSGTSASIELDGKNQYLGTYEPASLGIANTWTLGFWAKPLSNPEHTAIFSTASHRRTNEIDVFTTPIARESQLHGKRPASLRVMIKDASGTTLKHFGWGDFFRTDEWTHAFIQWDGTSLTAYKDGVLTTTGVVLTNVTGTMTDESRQIFMGSAVAGVTATFSGILGHFAVWDSILSPAEMPIVVSGGFDMDLTTTSGAYVSTGSLKHYWRPGLDDTNIGKDYAVSGTNPIDLTKEHNITEENVSEEAP